MYGARFGTCLVRKWREGKSSSKWNKIKIIEKSRMIGIAETRRVCGLVSYMISTALNYVFSLIAFFFMSSSSRDLLCIFFSIYLPSCWIQKQTECPRIVFVAQFPRIQVNNIFLHDSYHSFIWRRSVYDWFSSLYSLTSISNASDRSAWISNWMWCGAKLRLIWYRDRISMAIQNARR